MAREILLGSASPQRKWMLEILGFDFEIEPANIDEYIHYDKDPYERAELLAKLKAEELKKKHAEKVIVTGDSYGIVDGKIFEKAETKKEATEMLREISSKKVEVVSGYAVWNPGEQKWYSGHDVAAIQMRVIFDIDIEDYLQHDEWKGKAPPFTVLGRGLALTHEIEGDFYTAVGFPLSKVFYAIEMSLD